MRRLDQTHRGESDQQAWQRPRAAAGAAAVPPGHPLAVGTAAMRCTGAHLHWSAAQGGSLGARHRGPRVCQRERHHGRPRRSSSILQTSCSTALDGMGGDRDLAAVPGGHAAGGQPGADLAMQLVLGSDERSVAAAAAPPAGSRASSTVMWRRSRSQAAAEPLDYNVRVR